MQFSVGLRNARGDQIEAFIGASPVLEIRTGAKPASCSAPDSGTLLCSIALPEDWMGAFAGGAGAKNGTWTALGVALGDAGHFRIRSAGPLGNCHLQGTITQAGQSPAGDMEIDEVSIAVGQTVTVTLFRVSEGNA